MQKNIILIVVRLQKMSYLYYTKEKLKRQAISIKTEKNNFLSHEISETRTFGKNTDTFFVEYSFLCIFCNFSNQC